MDLYILEDHAATIIYTEYTNITLQWIVLNV